MVYVVDAEDRERLSEGWEVFGMYPAHPSVHCPAHQRARIVDSVLSAPQILNVPLLLLANKQDSPNSLSVEEIRHDYEDYYQRKIESQRRNRYDGSGDGNDGTRRERIASLEVLGVSAIEGYAPTCLALTNQPMTLMTCSTGVRDAVDWLFLRVQNSRRCVSMFATVIFC